MEEDINPLNILDLDESDFEDFFEKIEMINRYKKIGSKKHLNKSIITLNKF